MESGTTLAPLLFCWYSTFWHCLILTFFSVSLPQKIITLTTPFMGIQFLDVVPGLSAYGFGHGEISSDIKAGARAMECEQELAFFALSIFLSLVLFRLIHLQIHLK